MTYTKEAKSLSLPLLSKQFFIKKYNIQFFVYVSNASGGDNVVFNIYIDVKIPKIILLLYNTV